MAPLISSLLLLFMCAAMGRAVTVTVSAKASHPIPTGLWSQMYEDISYSGDGGLYGELLKNRAFQLVPTGTSKESLDGWQALGGASIAVVNDPISTALPNALELKIPAGRTGSAGVANTGFSGIKVDSKWEYWAQFFYRFPTSSSFSGNITVGLQTTSGQVLASNTAAVSGTQTEWKQLNVRLNPRTSASNTNNLFTLSLDAGASGGQTIHFALLRLIPPRYKNRDMRTDLAESLAAIKPGFFRFPGGNNLEGSTPDKRWKWFNTVGPLLGRPGRMGDWSYVNTDGLGLMEYLNWCEDIGAEGIMGVYAGYSLSGVSVSENELDPYIQEAIDQINFAIAEPTHPMGSLRGWYGRSEPYKLKYIEIGNEDWFAADTYKYRWKKFATALQKEFPQLKFIATTNPGDPVLDPKPSHYDVHVYQAITWFAQNVFYYDDFKRDGTQYFEGEYAAISTNPNDVWNPNSRLKFPTLQSAVSEAAFMTGLERNSDIVFAAAYAPLIGHATNNQWTPNLITHDAGSVYLSTSYYVQKLFGNNRGDEYLPSTLPDRRGTAFWSIVRNKASREIVIKIANTGNTATPFTFVLPFNTVQNTGTVETLAGTNFTASNTPASPNTFVPKTSTIPTGKTFNFQASPVSFSVIKVVAY